MERGKKKVSFFQNTCKPQGLGGKIMVQMMNKGHTAMAEWGMRHIDIAPDASVLDVGCGGGANLKRLLAMCPAGHVKGIDYSSVSVQMARKMTADEIHAGRCQVLEGNVMELPFEAGCFEVITAFETIYFWPDISQAFSQVYRVLKPGGHFMICNELNGKNPKDDKWTDIIAGMKIYRIEKLEQCMREAGFDSIKTNENEKGWICIVAKKRDDT